MSALMITLRPFQSEIIEQVEQAIAAGKRKIVAVLPTGAGKTVIAAEIIRRFRECGLFALFLAHRREIISQTSQRLTEHGMPLGSHGIIMAERAQDLRPQAQIQIASIDTLHARGVRSKIMELPPATLVIFDEAHRVRGRTRENLLKQYPDAILIGLTATPCRGDGRGLGNIFDAMVVGPQVQALTDLGTLVPAKVYAPVYRDVAKGVGTSQGDYIINQLSSRMNTAELVGDVVRDWLAHAQRRRTVAFSVDVAHAVNIRDEFVRAGVRAEFLTGETPTLERESILARLASGEAEVVANCMVLTEGWDCPPVSCCILARPTKQLGLYRQMVGRILRPAEGKTDAIILDHAGAVYRHGPPSDDIAWTLAVDFKAENTTDAARKRGEAPEMAKCPECSAIMTSKPPCWSCGWVPKRRGREVEFTDGELGLVIGGKSNASVYSIEDKRRWHAELAYIAQERGYQRGWIAHKYKTKFGAWPAWGINPEPIPPTPEVRSWVRSRDIAYAKSRRVA
jgi:superfamily II DNA or RNA helicase